MLAVVSIDALAQNEGDEANRGRRFNMQEYISAKIEDPRLKATLSSRPDQKVSVILLLAIQEDKVSVHSDRRQPPIGGIRPRTRVDIAPESKEKKEQVAQKARALVMKATGTEPVYIKSAGSLIVDVTSEELGRIARSPLIKSIIPNRRLR